MNNPAHKKPLFSNRAQDFAIAAAWARISCHLALSPEMGETVYRKLPAKFIFSLWFNHIAEA